MLLVVRGLCLYAAGDESAAATGSSGDGSIVCGHAACMCQQRSRCGHVVVVVVNKSLYAVIYKTINTTTCTHMPSCLCC